MEGYLLLAIAVIGLIVALNITRKDTAANNGFSKKGIMKLLVVLLVVFLSVVVVVFVTPESWM